MPKKILIVAGDLSADRYGEALVRALKRKHTTLQISALGGDNLKSVVDQFIFPLVGVGGFGFLEPLAKIPLLWNLYRRIRGLLKNDRPDAMVLMDYYGFNIHVARLAKSLGIPVFYYISPQVWASRPGRIRQLAKVVTRMLVIFPFEERLYQQYDVSVTYVGHPLLERLPPPAAPVDELRIGLLPGSRPGTIERHLPILSETADLLHNQFPKAQLLFFRPQEIAESLYIPFLTRRPWLRVVSDPSFEERQKLTLALSVSGTAALENTLLGIPMVIMYRLSTVTYWIARALIQVPFVGIPNLLAKRLLVPEFLQDDATPAKLAEAVALLLSEPAQLAKVRQELLALRQELEGGGSERAADVILRAISQETEIPFSNAPTLEKMA